MMVLFFLREWIGLLPWIPPPTERRDPERAQQGRAGLGTPRRVIFFPVPQKILRMM